MIEFGVGPVPQRADLLGLAVLRPLHRRGPLVGRRRDRRARRARRWSTSAKAIWALRVGAGVALIVVAFAEKLANPAMALDFLAEHPDFNVAALVGLPLGDLEFVRLAGAIEVLFGLLLISGALPQAIVLIAGIPFNATLWFFGTDELLGHLPVYGAMLVLLVYGSDPVAAAGGLGAVAVRPPARAGARAGIPQRMSFETILYATDGPVATITLNRPERLNTIVPPMPDEVEAAVARRHPRRRGQGDRRCAAPAGRSARGYDFGGGFKHWGDALRPTASGTRARTSSMATAPQLSPTQKLMSVWRSPQARDRAGPRLVRRRRQRLRALRRPRRSPARTPSSARPTAACGAPTCSGMWIYRLGLARAKFHALTGRP